MQFSNKINNLISMQKRTLLNQLFDQGNKKKAEELRNNNMNKLVECFNTSNNVKTKQIKILQIAPHGAAMISKKPFLTTQSLKKPQVSAFNHEIFVQLNNKARAQLLQAAKTSSYFFDKGNPNVNNGWIKNLTISPEKHTFLLDAEYVAMHSANRRSKKLLTRRKAIETLPQKIYERNLQNIGQEEQKQIIIDQHVSRSLNLIVRQKKIEQVVSKYENKSGTIVWNKNKPKPEQLKKTMQQLDEEERKAKLEIKRQINQDYAKPFNPPTNITAASYIIFEPNFSDNKDRRKYHKQHIEEDKQKEKQRGKSQGTRQSKKRYPHSHKIIAAFNSRNSVQIASLTKIMTCILALEICKKYKLDAKEQKILIGKFQSNIGGTTAQISQGQTYTLQDLYYGLMLPSGNDASVAIAVWAGRALLSRQQTSETLTHKKKNFYERFILQMNNKAKQLGMLKTNYANSHGLMNPQNRSCAYDLAILCEHAMSNPKFRQIVSCRTYSNTIQYNPNLNYPNLMKRKSVRDISKDRFKDDEIQQGQDKDLDSNQQQNIEQQNVQNEVAYRTVQWENTHQLVQQKPKQYIGIKTGITTAAGPCLASCVRAKNGRSFIIIVLNCQKMSMRFKDTQNLKKWAYQKEGIIKKVSNGNEIAKEQSCGKLIKN